MASVIVEPRVAPRNTVCVDAGLVDHVHPKKTIYSHGRLSPSGQRLSSAGVHGWWRLRSSLWKLGRRTDMRFSDVTDSLLKRRSSEIWSVREETRERLEAYIAGNYPA
jgi:hypothetical protein